MLHIGINSPGESTFEVSMSLDAIRKEHIQSRLYGAPKLTLDENSSQLAQYLKPVRLVPIDGQIRAWAREIVQEANGRTALEMAPDGWRTAPEFATVQGDPTEHTVRLKAFITERGITLDYSDGIRPALVHRPNSSL